MRNAQKKIFVKNDDYDDILGTVVTENKLKLWFLRIALILIPILLVLIVVRDLF